jgi:hypothetical protein
MGALTNPVSESGYDRLRLQLVYTKRYVPFPPHLCLVSIFCGWRSMGNMVELVRKSDVEGNRLRFPLCVKPIIDLSYYCIKMYSLKQMLTKLGMISR